MDEHFVQGVVGGVLNRHKDRPLDEKRIQTLMVEISAVLDRATECKSMKKEKEENLKNYNFIMSEMSQGEREHLFNWQQEKKYIYESPDGRYVFRRLAGEEYTPEQKEEINLRTGEPTGRTFADYPFSKGLAKDNPLSIEMWKGYTPSEESKYSKEYLEYWTCDICNEHTYEVDYDYLGNGTNHLGCELRQAELQTKSDKIMEKLDKDFENFDLSKSESNENSKVDMSAKAKRGKK